MEWISVDDRLPEDTDIHFYEDGAMRFTTVLVYNSTVRMSNRILVHNKANYPNIEKTKGYEWSTFGEITHWMPLPEPPKPQEIFKEFESLAELKAEMKTSEDYKRGYEAGVTAENNRIQELIRGLLT